MNELFMPKSIALIGATPKKEKASYTILHNLLSNFKGKVFLVNPNYKEINGIPCYKSVGDIKEKIDVAVVVVNASIANSVIKECIESHVKYVIVITAGYREIGGEGIKREQELIKMIKLSNYRTRVVGPNCLGVLDNISSFDALFIPSNKVTKPKKGEISLIFQSGALGAALIDRLGRENIGVARFVSYGNACDLNELDFLEYFVKKDKQTKVIGMYIEGVRDGRKLYSILKSSKKPIVIIKGGKTEKGSKAALTHTGTLAGNYDIFKGVIHQANAVLAENFREFENYIKIFSLQRKMKSNKIMVITNGGGFGVIAADEISRSKLSLYEITKKEEEMLKDVLPSYSNVHNPLDLIGDATSERYKKALEVFEKQNEIGAFLVIMLVQTFSLDEKIVDVLASFSRKVKKPVVCVIEGGEYALSLKYRLETKGALVYHSVNEAVDSLEKLYLWSIRKKY